MPRGQKSTVVKWVSKGRSQKVQSTVGGSWYNHRLGVDYNEIFAFVAHLGTIRLVISLAAQYNQKLYQTNGKSVFLNGYLREVHIEEPLGYNKKKQDDKVFKLKKAFLG